jgi:23S rRNA (uracil1939-C5)-methyltransferase
MPMLTPGVELELTCDKAIAGGRMLARFQGQVVLVAGAIPGERVLARIDRVARQVAYGETIRVLIPDPDRRAAGGDRACGGSVYAHIRYPRQLSLKADVIADAFGRIAKLPLAHRVPVAPSPEDGYRMRARLHVRDGRIGFFREGTHELCEAGATGQLLPATLDLLSAVSAGVGNRPLGAVRAIEVVENVPADQRVLHVEVDPDLPAADLRWLADLGGVTGLTWSPEHSRGAELVAGRPAVTDCIRIEQPSGEAGTVTLRHHVRSFFQGNRWLLQDLTARVLRQVPDGDVVDLYAGVGLFGVCLAARGASVVAVEGDDASAADLEANAAPYATRIRAHAAPVEEYLRRPPDRPGATVVVDPPRTGMSRAAVAGLLRRGAPRVVYVSCDLATLARDVRSFIDRGYALEHLEALDLFPNTAHVETLAVLARDAG